MPDETTETAATRTARRGLRPGSRVGLGVAALLAVWGAMVLAWPVAVAGADGQPVACGSAAGSLASAGTACLTATGQLRLQALALFAAALVVALTALAVFGSEPVEDDAPAA